MSATTTALSSPTAPSWRPIARALSLATGSPEWKQRSVCARETPAAPELWTPDRRPTGVIGSELTRMCHRCPVRRQCAAAAIADGSECGMYAGVFVPERRSHGAWEVAMAQLQAVIDEAEPAPLAVSA